MLDVSHSLKARGPTLNKEKPWLKGKDQENFWKSKVRHVAGIWWNKPRHSFSTAIDSVFSSNQDDYLHNHNCYFSLSRQRFEVNTFFVYEMATDGIIWLAWAFTLQMTNALNLRIFVFGGREVPFFPFTHSLKDNMH